AVVVLVSLEVGVAVIPNSLLRAVTIERVTYRPLAAPQILSEIAVAFRRSEWAPATQAFIAQIRGVARTLPAGEKPV
ncbi:MAG: hypothetical protein ABII76_11355, partial [Pseudomonadota bacterium]